MTTGGDAPVRGPARRDEPIAGRAGAQVTGTPASAGPRERADVVRRDPDASDERADAVRRDPDACYERAARAAVASEHERAVISAQLGRPARGTSAVVHRCVYGLPTVVRVSPRLDDGTPFPTTFWLTCPVMRSRVGTLEADHAMVGLNERLSADPAFAAAYAGAHERYLAFRDQLGGSLPDPTVSAGGMPGHVKCLHVHAAHHLATGDNVVGAWTVEQATPAPCPEPCVVDADVAPHDR